MVRLVAFAVAACCFLQPGLALAQDTARQLAGSWKLTSWTISSYRWRSHATIRPQSERQGGLHTGRVLGVYDRQAGSQTGNE